MEDEKQRTLKKMTKDVIKVKRWICAFLALGVMCSAAGCRDAGLARPDFPLDEQTVTAALTEAGLPGAIVDSETRTEANGSVSYAVREPAERSQMSISISSSAAKGTRVLQVACVMPAVSEIPAFEWDDWKQQLIFAALLSGGFADSEELYRSFSAQELPDEEPSAGEKQAYMPTQSFTWDSELQGGYCIVRYRLNNARIEYSTFDTKVLEYSQMLIISVFESKAYYEDMQAKARESMNAAADKAA